MNVTYKYIDYNSCTALHKTYMYVYYIYKFLSFLSMISMI